MNLQSQPTENKNSSDASPLHTIRVVLPKDFRRQSSIYQVKPDTTYGMLKMQVLQKVKGNSEKLQTDVSNFILYCEKHKEMKDERICNPEIHLKIDDVCTINLIQAQHKKITETNSKKSSLSADDDYQKKKENGFLVAAQFGCTDMLQVLFKKGVSVNIKKERTGETALHLASIHGNYKVVQLLLTSKADINAEDNKSNTALSLAKKHNRADIIELLQKSSNVMQESLDNTFENTITASTSVTATTITTTTTTTVITATAITPTAITPSANIDDPAISYEMKLFIALRRSLPLMPKAILKIIRDYTPMYYNGRFRDAISCFMILKCQPTAMVFDGERMLVVGVKSKGISQLSITEPLSPTNFLAPIKIDQKPGNTSMLTSLAVTDKYLYVLDWFCYCFYIFEVNPNPTNPDPKSSDFDKYIFKKYVGSRGSLPGQFRSPRQICATSKFIYVGDNPANPNPNVKSRIQKFTPDGEFISSWEPTCQIQGMAISDDYVYITDLVNKEVHLYTHDGQLTKIISNHEKAPYYPFAPSGIAVQDCFLYVYNGAHEKGRVLVFDYRGTYVSEWGGLRKMNHSLLHVGPDCIYVSQHGQIKSFQ